MISNSQKALRLAELTKLLTSITESTRMAKRAIEANELLTAQGHVVNISVLSEMCDRRFDRLWVELGGKP